MSTQDSRTPKPDKSPPQRKTTFKWNSNGELSAVDMARVLERLTNPALTQCDLACELDQNT
ncbi:hypothetical protein [Prochlorococcus marinus]|uniref:Uncharacterized protein n=1 Tax=Prochlorococcus marinus (strain MIT 9303) TaxID=59922 RepID=A2C919_PROM3|nr:hypothetical protein [Prochlorococcus marinus]ABM77979.1 Hypothetical protein P9303_12301 [Prochlorococcus marinus str. MIT 9303]|tara:strand:+ start:345 stop:527 length:183 start_codon:yes stop_codon:yes gene_type:complete